MPEDRLAEYLDRLDEMWSPPCPRVSDEEYHVIGIYYGRGLITAAELSAWLYWRMRPAWTR